MRDVTCWRTANDTAECSIPQRHIHASPTGHEWGYSGSGPSDLALNILALAIGPAPDALAKPGEDADEAAWEAWFANDELRVKLWDGSFVHRDVWHWHEDFKRELVATMPREGGVIPGVVVEAWVTAKRRQREEEPAR